MSPQEHQIVTAVETMVDRVNAGDSPDDALFKVASSLKLTPEFVRRQAEVFNTSRVLAHLGASSGAKRADTVPLADAEAVIQRMYPKDPVATHAQEKRSALSRSAHSSWFGPPPDFNEPEVFDKSASWPEVAAPSPYPIDEIRLIHRAETAVASAEARADIAERDAAACMSKLASAVRRAAEYFRVVGHRPFAEVESAVLGRHGDLGRVIMDAVYKSARCDEVGEKRATAPCLRPVTATAPFDAVDEARSYASATAKAATFAKSCSRRAADLRAQLSELRKSARPQKAGPIDPFADIVTKEAAGIIPTLASTTFIGTKLHELSSKVDDPAKHEMRIMEALDPEQEIERRTIAARAMLNDLMVNDPVISRADPDDVVHAFNELSQLTPQLASQPGMLRGLLARRLELGRLEPFEAEQIIRAESGLRAREPSFG